MLINIKYKEVRVRRPNSHLFKGEDKFTGSVTYSVIGSLDREPVRLSLGTEEKGAAIRRVSKIEKACAEGSKSSLWHELEESLPPKTFKFFADRAGYVGSTKTASTITPTWDSLCDAFEIEMTRCIANKKRGASRNEGIMSESTRDRYRQTIRHFTSFLADKNVPLAEIQKATIAMFKIDRQKKIEQLKQSRGGSSIALDVAVLHRMFAFAVAEGLMLQKPISLKNESKPGANPKNGARSFNADEITKLREAAELVNNGGKLRK